MFQIKITGSMRSGLMGLFGKMKKTLEYSLWLAALNIRDEMQEPGKPISYPVQWDSTKQRKAFFATDGFGRGIPTKRSGQAVGAWKAIRIQDGAEVSNPLSHIMFISGKRQSRIHRGRWKLFHIAIESVLRSLPKSLRDRLIVTIQEQGFETR